MINFFTFSIKIIFKIVMSKTFGEIFLNYTDFFRKLLLTFKETETVKK